MQKANIKQIIMTQKEVLLTNLESANMSLTNHLDAIRNGDTLRRMNTKALLSCSQLILKDLIRLDALQQVIDDSEEL